MLEQAFEALKTYKWGIDPKGIKPIQDAVVATHGNAAARKELESMQDSTCIIQADCQFCGKIYRLKIDI